MQLTNLPAIVLIVNQLLARLTVLTSG